MEDFREQLLFYLDQMWRRRWVALSFAWLVCALGWSAVAFLPDEYASDARIYVDTDSLLNPLLQGIAVDANQDQDQEVAIMQRTLTSRPNLTQVARMTDLDKSVNSDGEMQALLDDLEERVSIRAEGPKLFRVSFSDNQPTTARNVVQALLTIFVESTVGNKREDMETARSFIETQIEEYERQLEDAEQKLADFKVENLQYLSNSAQSFAVRLENQQALMKELQFQYDDGVAELEQLRERLEGTPQLLSMETAPAVNQEDPLLARIRALQTQMDQMQLLYTERHPEVRRLKEILASLENQARQQGEEGEMVLPEALPQDTVTTQTANPVFDSLSLRVVEQETVVASSKRRLDEAISEVNRLEDMAATAPGVEADFTALNRDYEVIKNNYENLLGRREAARISQAAESRTEPVQFRIIAAPEIPAKPEGPNRPLFNVAVFVVGLGAGFGFAFLMIQIDDRISTPEKLMELTGLPILGTVSPVAPLEGGTHFLRKNAAFASLAAFLIVASAGVVVTSPNLSDLPDRLSRQFASTLGTDQNV